jgi:phytanoyl-CoA hydroxylase
MVVMSTTATDELISPQQLEQYRRDGYLIVEDLLTDDEIDAFLANHTKEKEITWGLHGHARDAQCRHIATHPRVVGIVRRMLGGEQIRIVQTMYLNKSPQGGQGIALHQDTHYLPSEPNTLMACWIALTDTGAENGGLCVVPGSHAGGLRETHRTENEKEHMNWISEYDMRDRDGREWKQKMFAFEIDGLDESKVKRLTVPKGAGVFFTGLTIHGSFSNQSVDKPRRAFATHYVKEGTWLFRKDVQETMPI